jgi:phosphoglycolate phosphatase
LAARRDSIQLLADSFGIRGHLHDVLGLSDHYAHGKFDLGVRWLARSGADREKTVFVGDTVHDHEVAQAMGVECLLLDRGHHTRERLEATGRRVVESVRELSEALFGGPLGLART